MERKGCWKLEEKALESAVRVVVLEGATDMS